MNYPKYNFFYILKSFLCHYDCPEPKLKKTLFFFLIKKNKTNKDNKMFLIAFTVLVLCIGPCFLYLLWPSLKPRIKLLFVI